MVVLMRRSTSRHAVTLALLCASIASMASCDAFECDEQTEDDRFETCAKVSSAVDAASSRCDQPPPGTAVCGEVCEGSSIGRCRDHTEIEACVSEILAMSCSDLTAGAYKEIDACSFIFRDLARSCERENKSSSGSGSGIGFDDWDD